MELSKTTDYSQMSVLEQGERFREALETLQSRHQEASHSKRSIAAARKCLEAAGIEAGPFELMDKLIDTELVLRINTPPDEHAMIGPLERNVAQSLVIG